MSIDSKLRYVVKWWGWGRFIYDVVTGKVPSRLTRGRSRHACGCGNSPATKHGVDKGKWRKQAATFFVRIAGKF